MLGALTPIPSIGSFSLRPRALATAECSPDRAILSDGTQTFTRDLCKSTWIYKGLWHLYGDDHQALQCVMISSDIQTYSITKQRIHRIIMTPYTVAAWFKGRTSCNRIFGSQCVREKHVFILVKNLVRLLSRDSIFHRIWIDLIIKLNYVSNSYEIIGGYKGEGEGVRDRRRGRKGGASRMKNGHSLILFS